MKIYIVTSNDKKYDEKYRNFCYKSVGSMKKNLKDDIEKQFADMDDYITESDEEEIDMLVSRITNTFNAGKCFNLKNMGVEFSLRIEELK